MLLSTRLGSRLRLTVRTWLVLTCLAALLPMLAVSSYTVYRVMQARQADAEASLQRRANVAAVAVARELLRHETLARVLVLSDGAQRGDLPALHAMAARVAAADPNILSISVSNPAGVRLFNSRFAYGAVLPASNIAPMSPEFFSGGERWVSGVARAAASDGWGVLVAVPLVAPDQTPLALRVALRPNAIGQVFAEQAWPAEWTATVVDQEMRVVARSRDAAQHIGGLVSASMRDSIREAVAHRGGEGDGTRGAGGGVGSGLAEVATRDGQRVINALARVPGTAWVVAVGRPLAQYRGDLWPLLARPAAFALLAVLLAGLGSLLLARELDGALRSVVQPSAPGEANLRAHPLAEIRALGHTAVEAHKARYDALTGLLTRRAYTEQAEALLVQLPRTPEEGAALLFIDLDGFKSINDQLGHAEGDEVLRAAASVMRSHVRETDLAARMGGDEFVLLLRAPTARLVQVAREVAWRVVRDMPSAGAGMGCSVGVACYDAARHETLARWHDDADQAMLDAKRAGKARVHMAS